MESKSLFEAKSKDPPENFESTSNNFITQGTTDHSSINIYWDNNLFSNFESTLQTLKEIISEDTHLKSIFDKINNLLSSHSPEFHLKESVYLIKEVLHV